MEKAFTDSHRTTKFVKVFSLESFPLYFMAGCFIVVEHVSTWSSSSLINTDMHSAMVIIVFSYQVAIVLLCPGGGAGGLSLHHQEEMTAELGSVPM